MLALAEKYYEEVKPMKIEKVNDNQIRCTLTKADLADRQLKLSELAYGTEKAKSLFRDMMQQASYELGFEANDIPLMIEAIPLSSESIILIITKVEDPDELDTRFANFAPSIRDEEDDVISELFRSVSEEMPERRRLHLLGGIHGGRAVRSPEETRQDHGHKDAGEDPAGHKVCIFSDLHRIHPSFTVSRPVFWDRSGNSGDPRRNSQ